MEKNAEAVKVCIRVRPQSIKERREGQEEIVSVDDSRAELTIRNPEDLKKPLMFTYDFAFGQSAMQSTIYEACSQPVVASLLDGFNCTIFAYGQTGSGKTFTMEGVEGDPNLVGVIPRSFSHIFGAIRAAAANEEHLVRASMLEIYNEELRDSLSKSSDKRDKLEIHEDPRAGFYVRGLSIVTVKNEAELMELVSAGKSSRKVRATAMNDYSSRSHSILSIIVESSVLDSLTGQTAFKIGKLNLVDLAGSEKQKQTKTSDEALKEGININLSLTTLGNVINLLVKGAPHVPYRNSKLTKLLSDSLGGNSKTLMIATVSPALSNFQESLQTLKYASRAKMITNKPRVNEDAKDALLRQKQDELKLLRIQIERLAAAHGERIDGGTIPLPADEREPTRLGNKQLKNLTAEESEITRERQDLRRQLEEKQERVRREEGEKLALISKYNAMCKDIISKHDYERDLTQAREELEKLNSDKTDQRNYVQTQQLLRQKKQAVDSMEAQTKQIQDQLLALNQKIASMRDRIGFFKQNRQTAGQDLSQTSEDLSQQIQQRKMTLKRQSFFLQQLIPDWFRRLIEGSDGSDQGRLVLPAYAFAELKRPLARPRYTLACSYENPYIREINLQGKTHSYPSEGGLYDDGRFIRLFRSGGC